MFRSLLSSSSSSTVAMKFAGKILPLSIIWLAVAHAFQSPGNILSPPHHARAQTHFSLLQANREVHVSATTALHASPTLQELERLELIPLASTPSASADVFVVDNDGSLLSPFPPPIISWNDTTSGAMPRSTAVIPSSPALVVPGQLLVLIAAAMYGTNFPCVKLLDQIMPSALSAALRFSLAAVVVGGAVLLSEQQRDGVDKDRLPSMLRGMEVGAWYGMGYISQAAALHTVEAGKCAFFGALAVVIVPLLDALFKKVSPSLQSVGAVLLAISGVAILELGGLSAAENISSGDIMSAFMACSFAVGYWRLGSASEEYPQQAARITLGQLISVAIGSVVYASVSLPPALFSHGHHNMIGQWLADPFILGALAWTGLASTALAIYMETIALRTISASELTVLMTSTSLWAAAFGYVTLGEVMSPTSLAGGLLILTACLLSAKNDENSEPDVEDEGLNNGIR